MITKIKEYIKYKITTFLNNRNWYKLSELQIGGHCGLCGDWIGGEIYPIAWPYGLCNNCLGKNIKEVFEDNESRIINRKDN